MRLENTCMLHRAVVQTKAQVLIVEWGKHRKPHRLNTYLFPTPPNPFRDTASHVLSS